MPDDVEGQEPEQQEQQEQSQEDDHGQEPNLPPEVLDKLRNQNRENQSLRDRLRETEQRLKTFEDERLSEAEKLQRRVRELEEQHAEAERRLRERELQHEVAAVAGKLGFLNPAVAHRLLDAQGIEFDDKGKPKNIEPLLRDLLKAEPYLARTGSADAGSGRRSGGSGGGMNQLIRQAAGRGGT